MAVTLNIIVYERFPIGRTMIVGVLLRLCIRNRCIDTWAEWSKEVGSSSIIAGCVGTPQASYSLAPPHVILENKIASETHANKTVAIGTNPKTLWPSGLRRWLKAPVRKGVGSNPTGFILPRGARVGAIHLARAAWR